MAVTVASAALEIAVTVTVFAGACVVMKAVAVTVGVLLPELMPSISLTFRTGREKKKE